MIDTARSVRPVKYPLPMRILHWLRAFLILGLLVCGWYMSGLPENETSAFLYSYHKQFGVLVFCLALVHLALRWRYQALLPQPPAGLSRWERVLSHAMHRLIIALTLLVPFLGYALSSSFTQSEGVSFFFFGKLPEFLPKSDAAFEVYRALHTYAAYLLLACILLHIAGGLKHRFFDRGGQTDVLPRML